MMAAREKSRGRRSTTLPEERRPAIVGLVQVRPPVRAGERAAHLGMSIETPRRDQHALEQEGLTRRRYEFQRTSASSPRSFRAQRCAAPGPRPGDHLETGWVSRVGQDAGDVRVRVVAGV
jgi:hypothetical protein